MFRLHLNGQHILRLGTSSGLYFFRISSEKFPALESNFNRQIMTDAAGGDALTLQ